ncbi:MAG: hypothetical protein AAGI15_13415 [Pseudomonadota bacterium]
MSEQYRLLFQGELLEGQHPAVVRKKLRELLKLDDAQLERLFSGDRIVVKKAVDEATAAKYLGAFRKAGAKLRLEEGASASAATAASEPANADAAAPGPKGAQAAASAEATGPDSGLSLSPAGSDLLQASERTAATPREVATDHLSLAEPGAALSDAATQAASPAHLDIDFDLAEPGALMIDADERAEPAPNVAAPDLSLAEPGAAMSRERADPTPSAPDTSHLSLDDDR